MKKILIIAFAALSLVLLLSACITPYSTPELNPRDADFPSLSQIIGELPEGDALDVLSVHGMCTHGREWVVEAGRQFSEFLAFDYREPDEPLRTVDGVEIWVNQLTDVSGKVVLRNYALVWSPLTTPAKQSLCKDASAPTGSCAVAEFDGKRASINSKLKSQLMNDCFSDALIYVGPNGDIIRNAMKAAIIDVGRERNVNENPLVIITESLGSKVVADSVLGSDDQGRNRALEALRGTRIMFMAANQIPLINLAYPSVIRDDVARSVFDDLRKAIQTDSAVGERTERSDSANDIYIVAFSDPNDLLTYELAIPQDRTTVNIRVSNAPSWFVYFENPDTAHRGYLENDVVWQLINCGNSNSCN